MSGLLKSLEYSLRYIALIIIFYFLGIKYIYVPNLLIICLVPVNFLAIHYGILSKIKKDNYVDKYYILFSLLMFTSILNIVFLNIVKCNMWVIVISVFINMVELIYLDLPGKKLFDFEIVESGKKKSNSKKN